MMMKAQDIMTTDVVTIRGSATVAEAVAMMNELCLRALIVERRHEQDAYGIVTETDIVYKVAAYGVKFEKSPRFRDYDQTVHHGESRLGRGIRGEVVRQYPNPPSSGD